MWFKCVNEQLINAFEYAQCANYMEITMKKSGKHKYDKGYNGSTSGTSGSSMRGNNYKSIVGAKDSKDSKRLSGQKAKR